MHSLWYVVFYSFPGTYLYPPHQQLVTSLISWAENCDGAFSSVWLKTVSTSTRHSQVIALPASTFTAVTNANTSMAVYWYTTQAPNNLNDGVPVVIPANGNAVTMFFDTSVPSSYTPRQQLIGAITGFSCTFLNSSVAPQLVKLVADQPWGSLQFNWTANSTMTIIFDRPTDMGGFAVGQVLTRSQVDLLFNYSTPIGSSSNSYTGVWLNSTFFVLTNQDANPPIPLPTPNSFSVSVANGGVIRGLPFTNRVSGSITLGGTFLGSCALVQPSYCASLHRDPCTVLYQVCGNCSAGYFSFTPNSVVDDCQVVYTSVAGGSANVAFQSGTVLSLGLQVASGGAIHTGDRLQLRDYSSTCDTRVAGTALFYNASTGAFYQEIDGSGALQGAGNQLIAFARNDGSARLYRLCQKRFDQSNWNDTLLNLTVTVSGVFYTLPGTYLNAPYGNAAGSLVSWAQNCPSDAPYSNYWIKLLNTSSFNINTTGPSFQAVLNGNLLLATYGVSGGGLIPFTVPSSGATVTLFIDSSGPANNYVPQSEWVDARYSFTCSDLSTNVAPSLVSVVAHQPYGSGAWNWTYGSFLFINFDRPTDMANYAVNQNLTELQIEALFNFSQPLGNGSSFVGWWNSSSRFIVVNENFNPPSPLPAVGSTTVRVHPLAIIRGVSFSLPVSHTAVLLSGTFVGTCAVVPPSYCANLHRDPCTDMAPPNTCGSCSAGYFGTPYSNADDCAVVYTSLTNGSASFSIAAGRVSESRCRGERR